MIRGPRSAAAVIDYVARAHAAWNPAPDWVVAIAEEVAATSLRETAKKLGYSPSVVHEVIAATYRGDLGRVEHIARGALMGATVFCPVLDEIGRDRCRQEQSAPFRATNSTRAHLRRACRTCPNREVKS